MAFAFSNNVITQTGTDTNLSGLANLTGVTRSGNIYIIDGTRRLVINGNLTINPEENTLVMLAGTTPSNKTSIGTVQESDFRIYLGATGNLTIGRRTVVGNKTTYAKGTAIIIYGDSPVPHYPTGFGTHVDGGSITAFGGTIITNPCISFGGINLRAQNVNVTIEELTVRATGGNQVRFDSTDAANVNIDNIILDSPGGNSNIVLFSNGFDSFSATIDNFRVQSFFGQPHSLLFNDLKFANNQSASDIVANGGGEWLFFRNTDIGSSTIVTRNNTTNDCRFGWLADFESTLLDPNGDPIEGATIRTITNAGARAATLGTIEAAHQGVMDLFTLAAATEYTGTTDANGQATITLPLRSYDAPSNTYYDFSDANDNYTFQVRHYEYVPNTITEQLRDAGGTKTTTFLSEDDNVTLSETAAGALTGISIQPSRIEDGNLRPAIVITRDGVTYQEIYDYWKWWHTRTANIAASTIELTVVNGRIRFGNYATRAEMYEIVLDGNGHLSTDKSVFNGFATGTVVDQGQPENTHEMHDDDDYTGLIVVDPATTLNNGTFDLTTNNIYFYIDTAGTYRITNTNVTTGTGRVIFVIRATGVSVISDLPTSVISNGVQDDTEVTIGGITYQSTHNAAFSRASSKLTVTGVGADESISIYVNSGKTTRPAKYNTAQTGSTEYVFEGITYTGTGTFNVWVVVTDTDGETRSKKFALTAGLEDQTFDFTLNASIGSVAAAVNDITAQVTTAQETAEWLQTGGKLLGIKPLTRNFTDWKANR